VVVWNGHLLGSGVLLLCSFSDQWYELWTSQFQGSSSTQVIKIFTSIHRISVLNKYLRRFWTVNSFYHFKRVIYFSFWWEIPIFWHWRNNLKVNFKSFEKASYFAIERTFCESMWIILTWVSRGSLELSCPYPCWLGDVKSYSLSIVHVHTSCNITKICSKKV
jgi:hypothetical protein